MAFWVNKEGLWKILTMDHFRWGQILGYQEPSSLVNLSTKELSIISFKLTTPSLKNKFPHSVVGHNNLDSFKDQILLKFLTLINSNKWSEAIYSFKRPMSTTILIIIIINFAIYRNYWIKRSDKFEREKQLLLILDDMLE